MAQVIISLIASQSLGSADRVERAKIYATSVDLTAIGGATGISPSDLQQLATIFAEAPYPLAIPGGARSGMPDPAANLAAVQLTEEGYGSIACAALLAIGTERLIANAMNADEVVILDGCPMVSAKKIAGAHGVAAGQHLVMTQLGIEKNGMGEVQYDEIEIVVAAVDQKITGA